MYDYDIHRNKMKCYYITKALHHNINLSTPNVYNAPDKLDWRGCCKETVKDTKANGKYEAKKSDILMGWF